MASVKDTQKITLEEKLNDVLKAINKLSGKITSLENKFSIFESRINNIDDKYSEKCSELKAEISALNLNVTHIECISTKIETDFNAKFEKLDEKKLVEAEKYDALKQRVAKLERDSIMRESYDKRLNVLIHGLKETERESKQQSKIIFEAFLKEALNLEHDSIKICTVYISARSRKQIKRSFDQFIIKLLSTYDKDKLYENISKLKAITKTEQLRFLLLSIYPKYFTMTRSC